jgi:hypothetical protein
MVTVPAPAAQPTTKGASLAAHHALKDAHRREHRGDCDPRQRRIGVIVRILPTEGKVHVLKVHRDAGHDFFIDVDRSATPEKPAPDSVGDQDVFNAKFFMRNEQVGRDGGVCTLVELPSIYHCNATNWFDKGQLTVQTIGDFSSTEPGHFAITGGTGAYRGARGEVKYVAKPDGADVTFRFRTR